MSKKQRKEYEKPKNPYNQERVKMEKKIMNRYGLKKKRELWKYESILRNYVRRARELQATKDEEKEKKLIDKLVTLGILGKDIELDDILDLDVSSILDRRLQTLVHEKGIAKTIAQARQMIVHGHIKISEQRVQHPNYLVKKEEEKFISGNI